MRTYQERNKCVLRRLEDTHSFEQAGYLGLCSSGEKSSTSGTNQRCLIRSDSFMYGTRK